MGATYGKLTKEECQAKFNISDEMMAKVEAEAKKFMYGDEEITHESFLEDTSAMFGANGKEMVEAFDKLFVALDADKSNSITVDEMIVAFSVMLCGTLEQKFRAMFDLCDDNKDGDIDLNELKNVLAFGAKMAQHDNAAFVENGYKLSEEQLHIVDRMADVIMEECDKNGDKKLQFNEIMDFIKANPEIFADIKMPF